MRVVLIFLSNVLDELRLGDMLISSKCGRNLESRRISKPKISKQIFLFLLHRE